jgi:hypothetical protein
MGLHRQLIPPWHHIKGQIQVNGPAQVGHHKSRSCCPPSTHLYRSENGQIYAKNGYSTIQRYSEGHKENQHGSAAMTLGRLHCTTTVLHEKMAPSSTQALN